MTNLPRILVPLVDAIQKFQDRGPSEQDHHAARISECAKDLRARGFEDEITEWLSTDQLDVLDEAENLLR